MSTTLPPIKVVVAGPVGAGKSTFVRAVSQTPVVSSEEMATEKINKPTTTVALDFGTILFDDQPVHVFGTPGQERFDFMWDILCQGATGMVFLVAGDNPKEFQNARHILEFVTSRFEVPFVIGVTRQDSRRKWSPEDVAEFFQMPADVVFGMDARVGNDCQRALYNLFELVDRKS